MSILIVNPNSSVSITDGLKDILDPAPEFVYKFFTAPSGPAEIDSVTTEIESAAACLPALEAQLDQHDAFLIACYSDHPLVHMLREKTKKPVIGIFQASVLSAMAYGGKFAVVTTATIWEKLLDDAVLAFLGSHWNYAGTYTTGLSVLELHGLPKETVFRKIGEAAKKAKDAGAEHILLGCAGMSGMDEAIERAVGRNIRVIDGVKAGTEILVGLLRSADDR